MAASSGAPGAPYYPCTDFVYAGASRIPFSQFSDWACCAAYATFNYYDYMGSLRETTSYAGLSAPYQNDSFGDNSSPQPSWFGFAEMLGSGVQWASARGYHQTEARWLSPDPAGMAAVDPMNPQSWNRYAYVGNNPVSFVDPSGLFGGGPATSTACSSDGPSHGGEYDCRQTVPGITVDVVATFLSAAETFALDISLTGLGAGSGTCYYALANPCGGGRAANNATIARPTWKGKNNTCLSKFNNTFLGKFDNFFSPLSMIPGIGPDWKGSMAEDVGLGAAKYGIYKFFQAAGNNWSGTGLGSIGEAVSGTIEGVAGGLGAPLVAGATLDQVSAHIACAITAAF